MKRLHELFKLITVLTLMFIFSIGCSKDSDDIDDIDEIYTEWFSSENGNMKLKFSGIGTIHIPNDTIIDFIPRLASITDNYIGVGGKIYEYDSNFAFSLSSSIIKPGVYSESIECKLSAGTCRSEPITATSDILPSWCFPPVFHHFQSSRLIHEITLTITQLNDERIEGTIKVVENRKRCVDNCSRWEITSITYVDGYFNILRE